MDNLYITLSEKDEYKFKNVKIEWFSNDVTIFFLEEGYATETFFIIKCFILSEIIKIDNLFLIKKNEKSEIKEIIDIKILEMGYKDFISWITDRASRNSIINSEDFEDSFITGIEIRLTEKNQLNWKPREEGCKKIINLINIWTLT